MADRLVINTGPLVTLARIEALDLPSKLPYKFLCPLEVRTELDAGAANGHTVVSPDWLEIQALNRDLSLPIVSVLDVGEAAVIQLALEQQIPLVCIDEWKGRRVAASVGLKVTGSLGLLGRAKMLGIIPAVKPLIERALQSGIRYHPSLVRAVLSEVGE